MSKEKNHKPESKQIARLLIADDEESMRFYLDRALRRRGFEVDTVESGEEAVDRYEASPFDVAILDLKMPGLNGIEALSRIRASDPNAQVILMTAYGTIRSAVEAIQQGALDYITKPFEINELLLLIRRACRKRSEVEEKESPTQQTDHRLEFGDLIGQSPGMREIYQTIDLLRQSSATVLISGETGTGKEILARAIHEHSERGAESFVALHCAAFPESLLESELFGYEAGAFTGARKRKRGLVEKASGGTLFLDEISEISLNAQTKLLRFLQERKITPLGGENEISIDLRFIAATSRDLEKMVEESRFRQDLFWRVNVIPIYLPPLRDRREDIPELAAHFLKRLADSKQLAVKGLTPDAMTLLASYPWPGNVRELENTIERMIVLHSSKETLDVSELPQVVRDNEGTRERPALKESLMSYQDALGAFERGFLSHLFRQTRGNVSQTARIMGISRQALHNKIKQLGLELEKFRE